MAVCIAYMIKCCIIPGVDCQCGEVYRLLVAVWIFVGLAWLAGVIGRVQKRLQSVANTIESRLLPPLSSNADHQVCVLQILIRHCLCECFATNRCCWGRLVGLTVTT